MRCIGFAAHAAQSTPPGVAPPGCLRPPNCAMQPLGASGRSPRALLAHSTQTQHSCLLQHCTAERAQLSRSSLVGMDGGAVQLGLALGVVAIVAVSGLMSGLTLGLLSLDRLDIEVMLRTGTRKQERMARRLLFCIAHPNWVLSTLVIVNTAAVSALPLCLDRLVGTFVALVLSTTALVLFGEILPQAVCSRHGLFIGGHAAPLVRVLMVATAPLSWPIGRILDVALGSDNGLLGSKRAIRALVDLHRESAGMGGPLNEEEATVIRGALDLGRKRGRQAMTPLAKVVMLSTDDVIDRPLLRRVLDTGHSRLPVYAGTNRANIVGLLLVKQLLGAVALAPPGAAPLRVGELCLRDLPALPSDTALNDLLNLFQTGHSHMALMLAPPGSTGTSSVASSSASGGGSDSSSDSDSSDGRSDASSSSSECGTPRSPSRMTSLVRWLSNRSRASRRSRHTDEQAEQPAPADVEAAAAGDGAVVLQLGELEPQLQGQQQEPQAPLVAAPPKAGDTAAAAAAGADAWSISAASLGAAVAGLAPGAAALRPPTPLAGVPVGIITLEDVLEELLGEEVVDETDVYLNNEQTTRANVRALAMSLSPALRRMVMAPHARTPLPPLAGTPPRTPGSGASTAAAGAAPAPAAAPPGGLS